MFSNNKARIKDSSQSSAETNQSCNLIDGICLYYGLCRLRTFSFSRALHRLHVFRTLHGTWHRLHVFPRFAPVACFPHLAPVTRFPHLAPVACFPALCTCILLPYSAEWALPLKVRLRRWHKSERSKKNFLRYRHRKKLSEYSIWIFGVTVQILHLHLFFFQHNDAPSSLILAENTYLKSEKWAENIKWSNVWGLGKLYFSNQPLLNLSEIKIKWFMLCNVYWCELVHVKALIPKWLHSNILLFLFKLA